MKVHVLPGDALAADFKNAEIAGEIIVCRECLIEGEVKAESLDDFWRVRARFISATYEGNKERYFQTVAGEFERLKNFAASGAEINLWFEHELFCQVNLWFCLGILRESGAKIYRVAPTVCRESEVWKGFGGFSAEELHKCFAARAEFSDAEISLGADLWRAYENKDYAALERLSAAQSKCFPYLREVVRAEVEKDTRPKSILREIVAGGAREFAEIFPEFTKRAGVYGFGDAQVRRILAEV